eukprot:Sdes_comp15899_c0_seq1m5022
MPLECSEFQTIVSCPQNLPPDTSNQSHAVLIIPDLDSANCKPPRPFPNEFVDAWNENFVRLPNSPKNVYAFHDQGNIVYTSRWDLIKSALSQPITDSFQFQRTVLIYNSRHSSEWEFSSLHSFFRDIASPEESSLFFQNILPVIACLALKLPSLCTQPIPLLKTQQTRAITCSQEQVSCLLANAFFCTFPMRNSVETLAEYSTFPSINFSSLFCGTGSKCSSPLAAKYRCIINYFRRVTCFAPPCGVITYQRIVANMFPCWEESTIPIVDVKFEKKGSIENEGKEYVNLDFANRFLGGGVLGRGAVQEEIRFMICPELLVTRLITEKLEDNEAVIVIGAERYSEYSGYSSSFTFVGDYIDSAPRDPWKRLYTQIIAIDAYSMSTFLMQLEEKYLLRELNKAYTGFYDPNSKFPGYSLPSLATGNWGCGAFGGDPYVKALVQWMAASVCGRKLIYFTFNNERLATTLANIYALLKDRNVTVGELYFALLSFRKDFLKQDSRETGYYYAGTPKLYRFLGNYFASSSPDPSRSPSSFKSSTTSISNIS